MQSDQNGIGKFCSNLIFFSFGKSGSAYFLNETGKQKKNKLNSPFECIEIFALVLKTCAGIIGGGSVSWLLDTETLVDGRLL